MLAAKLVDGGGLGFVRDTIVGLAGAVMGGLILHALRGGTHASASVLVEIVVSFMGAAILLLLVRTMGHGRSRRRVGSRRHF
ncbi:MAG: GlsB/YeaQ/YmgE family stress response membrane protein [Actinomycetota bacterium]|nr:GlsB/YeaQ/YmgE family stress response membrane protein [Actinomycetota bacterium]